VTDTELHRRVETTLKSHGLIHEIQWVLSGQPYLTRGTALLETARQAVKDELRMDPSVSTSGGTSDGRFIAPTGAEVIELGPLNNTIHQIDECIATADLERLANVYRRILEKLLS
jgi:succinyl-diaminopimelate desuccinylase